MARKIREDYSEISAMNGSEGLRGSGAGSGLAGEGEGGGGVSQAEDQSAWEGGEGQASAGGGRGASPPYARSPPRSRPQDFTLDFYFRQFWTDPRLAFRKRPGVETLSVGSEFIKNIWVPDTFFVNEKQSYFHIATTSNEFIRIHHSGSITRSIR
ncbi:CSON005521 protein [Gryllus bimaculatus]|nr:CSON005521 protein [Gryllus bimaculatus]